MPSRRWARLTRDRTPAKLRSPGTHTHTHTRGRAGEALGVTCTRPPRGSRGSPMALPAPGWTPRLQGDLLPRCNRKGWFKAPYLGSDVKGSRSGSASPFFHSLHIVSCCQAAAGAPRAATGGSGQRDPPAKGSLQSWGLSSPGGPSVLGILRLQGSSSSRDPPVLEILQSWGSSGRGILQFWESSVPGDPPVLGILHPGDPASPGILYPRGSSGRRPVPLPRPEPRTGTL